MEREQIIKALECCQFRHIKKKCDECKYHRWCEPACRDLLCQDALSLIKELTEENERLSAEYEKAQIFSVFPKEEELKYLNALERMAKEYKTVRADTVREMQTQIKALFALDDDVQGEIDQIAKGMLEGL